MKCLEILQLYIGDFHEFSDSTTSFKNQFILEFYAIFIIIIILSLPNLNINICYTTERKCLNSETDLLSSSIGEWAPEKPIDPRR